MRRARTEHEASFNHMEALDYAFGPSQQMQAMVEENAAEVQAEGAWLRWAEGGSPFSQQYQAEVDADLRRCGEPGL